jgi:predicted ATPase
MTSPDDEVAAVWQVGLLGGLRLRRGTQELTRLPSRAVTALLARLALEPLRAHPREELIELLWPGVAIDVGRNRLRQALSTLKSILEPAGAADTRPVLLADRTQVRVAQGALACDALGFERHVRAGRAASALELYRGELLPGFYDEWIDDERARLAALRDRLPDDDAAGGASVPDRPSRPAARVEPTPAGPSARVLLPTYLSRMFGAQAQAEALRARLLDHRLVTLVGPGGCGKTRLAVEVAHSLRPHAQWPSPVPDPPQPFDLIAFVPLAACMHRAQALDALTGALRLAPGGQEPLRALLDMLDGRRALLVLDNFEQLVGVADDLAEQLATELPLLHLLVTTRRALGVAGEHEMALAPLALPPPQADLAAAADNPAVGLFVERARAVRADFHLGARNAAPLAQLVRELEGMPLAIELAAARVRSIAPADMLARLRGAGTPRLDLLARPGARGTADARHASMQRVIGWSWDLLDVDQARLLQALTAFDGGFTAAAAARLTEGEPFDAALRLDELVAHSMVYSHADGDTLRFDIYQPVREYALAHADADQQRYWRAQLRRWAGQWAAGLPATPDLAELRAEMPNLVAALASAVRDGAAADGVALLATLRRGLEDVELPTEGLAHAMALVPACEDPALQAQACTLLGPLLLIAGQREAALDHARRGLRRDLLRGEALARALHGLARVQWRSLQRAEVVEPLLDEAEALARETGCTEVQAGALALRAFVANRAHRDFERGERLHTQALGLWAQLGNRHAVTSGLYNLAICAVHQRRPREAVQRLAAIIEQARGLGDDRRLVQALNVRGTALDDLREWPQALADYQHSIRLAWERAGAWDVAHAMWNIARPLAHLRQPERALRLLGHAQALWLARFGELGREDRFEMRRVRRLCCRQLGPGPLDALLAEGAALSLAQAVALALQPLPSR